MKAKSNLWKAWGIACWALLLLGGCSKTQVRPEPEPEPENLIVQESSGEVLKNHLLDKMSHLDSLGPGEKPVELFLLALDNFLSLAEGDRRVPELIMKKGDFYFEQSLYSEAIECFKIILQQYQDTPLFIEAMKKIAVAYARNGEMENAQNWYARLRDQGSDSLKIESRANQANILYIKARGLAQDKNYVEAKKIFLDIAANFPELEIAGRSLFTAGYMEENQNRYPQAIALYEQFMQNYPESPLLPQVLFHEALSWYKNGYYNKSAKKFLRVIKNFPTSPEAEKSLLQAGIAFENDGRLLLAGRTFEKYAELYPESNKLCSAIERANKIYRDSGIQENFDRVKAKYLDQCYQKTSGREP